MPSASFKPTLPRRLSSAGAAGPLGMSRFLLLVWASALAVGGASGCIRQPERCTGRPVQAGASLTCATPGYSDRDFDLEVPAGWDGRSPLPVVVAIHGGAGSKKAAATVTCPHGERGEAGCLAEAAKGRGFAVVLPDGTGARALRNVRTWNAGGGKLGFNCASGPACRSGVDDIRYFRELLDEVARIIPVDGKRVFATGLSNGAAMSHRLACELPERFAAIAAVGGTNQFAAVGGSCPQPIPVLQIHGTEDPCWTFLQSDASCIEGGNAGIKSGVAESMEFWRARNGCTPVAVESALPDLDPADGTRVVGVRWVGCAADVELLRIEGGGHTWPNGNQYMGAQRIGRVSRDLDSGRIVEFFVAHPRP